MADSERTGIFFMPGISLVAKMFIPLAQEIKHGINFYGLNWPFHTTDNREKEGMTNHPLLKLETKQAVVARLLTPYHLSDYVIGAFSDPLHSQEPGRVYGEELFLSYQGTVDEWVGFGHSAGGTALLLTEMLFPGTFSQLFLYEPVFIPERNLAPEYVITEILSLVERTMKRRRLFSSAKELKTHFLGRAPFSQISPTALDSYLSEAFRKIDPPGEEMEIVLEPELEAYFYERFGGLINLEVPSTLSCPLHVLLGSRLNPIASYSLEVLKSRFPGIQVTILDGLDHFGPFSEPSMIAGYVNSKLITI